jgi:hypothetical protein
VLQAIKKNFGLKTLALALAVLAWAYFHFSAAPSITAHFDQQLSVPIVVTGLRPEPGIINVPVKIVAPDVVIRSLSPASVTLSVDRLETRTVPVSISYAGGNGSLVVESSTVNPSVTTVRGIANDLAKVEMVKIEIPLGTKPGSFDAMVRPVAADARGNEVASTQVSPNLVRVRARFAPSSNSAGVK